MKVNDFQKFLDEYINPALKAHNGFLTIEKYDEDEQCLYVELGGGCQGCSAVDLTLKGSVETTLLERVPELSAVKDMTDHSVTENADYS